MTRVDPVYIFSLSVIHGSYDLFRAISDKNGDIGYKNTQNYYLISGVFWTPKSSLNTRAGKT